MGQFKRNDFVAEFDKKGRYVRTLMPPHRALVPHREPVNGIMTVVPGRYDPAPKGYVQPHKANGNNDEIALFGARYARKFRHDRRKRRNRVY